MQIWQISLYNIRRANKMYGLHRLLNNWQIPANALHCLSFCLKAFVSFILWGKDALGHLHITYHSSNFFTRYRKPIKKNSTKKTNHKIKQFHKFERRQRFYAYYWIVFGNASARCLISNFLRFYFHSYSPFFLLTLLTQTCGSIAVWGKKTNMNAFFSFSFSFLSSVNFACYLTLAHFLETWHFMWKLSALSFVCISHWNLYK